MTLPAIRVENVSKRYQIGAARPQSRTFREAIAEAAASPLQRLRRGEGAAAGERSIWALKEVSFEVEPGEVVGIIGRNGAGKSTLLKVLSRITKPTSGRAVIHGRVASLLEVGTGFHSELTGRENICLNGAILGMSRWEIMRKFDDIVAFAEVEKFIDTPVKRYSSGMYLRLAFAVAAHLEPEILVVDEVLAVGDAEFQKKCLGKMGEVAKAGRTVLFVSHQLTAVKSLCSRAIQIHQGMLVRDGEPKVVVDQYLGEGGALASEAVWRNAREQPGTPELRLLALRVLDGAGELRPVYSSSQPVIVELEFELASLHSALCVGFDLVSREGVVVFRSLHNDRSEREWPALAVGRNRLQCAIPPGTLNAGTYLVAPKIALHGSAWIVDGDAAVSFDVQRDHSDSPFWNNAAPAKFPGVIAPCLHWRAAEAAQASCPEPSARGAVP
jgi:lipopolysaccharide transport system ATP-binding protein